MYYKISFNTHDDVTVIVILSFKFCNRLKMDEKTSPVSTIVHKWQELSVFTGELVSVWRKPICEEGWPIKERPKKWKGFEEDLESIFTKIGFPTPYMFLKSSSMADCVLTHFKQQMISHQYPDTILMIRWSNRER